MNNLYKNSQDQTMTETGASNEILLNLGRVITPDGVTHRGSTTGSNGNDTIYIGSLGAAHAQGLDGDDKIYGNWGMDILEGGKGSDTLQGLAGKDTYLWRAADLGGKDRVLGFETEDRIMIQGLLNDDASIESKLAHLSLSPGKGLRPKSFSLAILDDDGNALQSISFEQSRLLFVSGSSDMKLRALLEEGTIVFGDVLI
jgi:Ca2+-binding RTX toxin-like protein